MSMQTRSSLRPFSRLAAFRPSVLGLAAALVLFVSAAGASGQAPEHENEIEGVVREATSGVPLAGAWVTVVGSGRGATSHGDGSFHIAGLASGIHTVRVERLGYRTVTVEASTEDVLVVDMVATPMNIGGIVVTGALTERSAAEALRPVNVLSGQDLQRRLQATVAATLAAEPGVAVTTMGPATARPVIRGLSGDRVLMLEDGSRSGDLSSTGSDHASVLDPSSARRIEVVRGPAAILYGSNALGGVINVIRDEVPSDIPHHPTGAVTLQGHTVTGQVGGSAHVRAALTDRIPVRIEVGTRTSGDLRTPGGRLDNTDAESWNAGGGLSFVDTRGYAGAAFRATKSNYGIPGGFVGGHAQGVRIEMERMSTRVDGRLDGAWGPFRSLEVDGAYNWYRHIEIEPPNILGTFFKLRTTSGDVLARHEEWGPFSNGAVGARASHEDFNFAGGLSTPDTRRYTLAGYVFEEIDLDPVRVEVGVRYDWAKTDPAEDDPGSSIGPIGDRTFQSASGSLGVLYGLGGGAGIGASVARAFRTPDVNELYSEGPHLAAYAFEVGNPLLENEVGTGIDLFVRLERERVSAEVTGFRNDISGYIYPSETGDTSRTNLPVYQFRGEDARLRGFEGRLDWSVFGDVTLHGTLSYVQGTLREADIPLPLIPPLQGRLGVEYERPSWFARVESSFADRQGRLGEFESPTAGYAVFDASAGLRLTVSGWLHVITVSGENLTDRAYWNHLSRVKEIMPEAGRGVTLTYRVVF